MRVLNPRVLGTNKTYTRFFDIEQVVNVLREQQWGEVITLWNSTRILLGNLLRRYIFYQKLYKNRYIRRLSDYSERIHY